MLKFFRKIRQELLSENHFSKYLLYAVGEILLVMIGILLALQINNWNQQRKDQIQEHYYLTALKEEMVINQNIIKGIINFHEAQLNRAQLVLDVLTEDTLVQDLETLHTALLHVGWAVNPVFVNHVWSELVSTGKVGLIQNNEIREAIAAFHSRASGFVQDESEWANFNLQYRNQTNGILPPKLRLDAGNALGFYKVNRKLEEDLLTQGAIASNLQNIKNIGGLISDIIIVRNVGLSISRGLENRGNQIMELLEQELEE